MFYTCSRADDNFCEHEKVVFVSGKTCNLKTISNELLISCCIVATKNRYTLCLSQ